MTLTINRIISLALSRVWLAVACIMLVFFSFASMACAAQCSGIDCAQMADKTIPTGSNNNQGFDIMIGGGCVLCCNVIADQTALTVAQTFRPLLYFAILTQHSSRHIAPDIPPPRIIVII
jgi:hypothetical protein